MVDDAQRPKGRHDLGKYTSAFMWKSLSEVPFNMTPAAINKRDSLRRSMFFFVAVGGVGGMALGAYFSKRYPKYKPYILAYFSLSSLVVGAGGYIVNMQRAKKFVARTVRGKNGEKRREAKGSPEEQKSHTSSE